jgi:hypothetical protein
MVYMVCVGHLFLVNFISSQSIKFNIMSKLPYPHFKHLYIYIIVLNPFNSKIDKLFTKGCTSSR